MGLLSLSAKIPSIFDKRTAQNKSNRMSIACNYLKIVKSIIIIDLQKLLIHFSTHWCRVKSNSAKYCAAHRWSAFVKLSVGVRHAAGR